MQRGFTLIEVLVALSIAAFALMALMGRMGASSDIQRTLVHHRLAMDVARNVLAEELLNKQGSPDERDGDLEWQKQIFHWRVWTEKTEIDRFVRRNVSVKVADEPPVKLFLFVVKP